MTLPVFAPSRGPTFPVSRKVTPRVNWAQFGDGYRQGAPDGLNFMDQTMSLQWENLEAAEKDEILDFFEAREGAAPFTYTFDGETTTFTVGSWTVSKASANTYNLSAEFERNFSA